jgi:hypothetical protein
MLPTSSTLMMMITTDKIIEVARNKVHEIGGQTVWGRLE